MEKRYLLAGCCSANKEILLSKAIEQKLRKGKNVLAMYCEKQGGKLILMLVCMIDCQLSQLIRHSEKS
jgi:putative hemolysin